MQYVLGIDFGTHSAKLAYLKGGTPSMIANAQGKFEIPFLLGIGKSNELLIGENARNRFAAQSDLFLHSFFPLLGRKYSDPFVDEYIRRCPEPIRGKNPDQDISFQLGGKEYSVLELCTLFFAHLKEEAESRSGLQFNRAILTLPAHFGERQVVSLKEAADRAGFDVLQVLNQPSAAAINFRFELEHVQDNQYVLVYSLGKVFDLSVLLMKKGSLTVLSSEGDGLIGGDLFNQRLVELLLGNLSKENKLGVKASVPLVRRMIPFVEPAKISLSSLESCEIRLKFSKEQGTLIVEINRNDFENMIEADLEKTLQITQKVLQQAQLSADRIDHVILVGGSTLIPEITRKLEQLFGSKKIKKSVNPFQAAALGAAIQSSLVTTYQCKKCNASNPIRVDQCQQCNTAFINAPKISCPICYLPNQADSIQCWKCGYVFIEESKIKESIEPDKASESGEDGRFHIVLAEHYAKRKTSGFLLEFAPGVSTEILHNHKGIVSIPIGNDLIQEESFRILFYVLKNTNEIVNFLGTLVYKFEQPSTQSTFNLIIEPDSRKGLFVSLDLPKDRSLPARYWYQGRRGKIEANLVKNITTIKLRPPSNFPAIQPNRCKQQECNQLSDLWCNVCGKTVCRTHSYPGTKASLLCETCFVLMVTREVQMAYFQGKLNNALELLKVIQPVRPDLADCYRGLILAEQKDFNNAIGLLQPTLNLNFEANVLPVHYAWAVLGKASVDLKKKDYLGAARGIAHSLNYDPILKTYAEKVRLIDWEALGSVENGDVEKAIQLWQNELSSQPFDVMIMHHLAVLNYRLACEYEERMIDEIKTSGSSPKGVDAKRLDQYWRSCVIYWSAVLYSSAFWDQWLESRNKETKIDFSGEGIIDQARESTIERVIQDLREYASQYKELKKTEHESRMMKLEVNWGLERATAEILGVVAIEFRIPGWPQGFSCGPLLLDDLRRNPNSEKTIISFSRSLINLNDPMSQTVKKYLSPSGRHYYMVEHNMLDQAIRELEPLEAWDQSREILALAYLRKGSDLLASQDVENGLTAFELAKAKGANVTPYAEEIAKASVLRSKDIIQSSSNPHDKVIWLLERARALAGNHPDICSNLGATLTQKAIMLNNSKNYSEAEKLIRRAIQLTPTDNHTKKTASIILSNQALEYAKLNQREKAIAIMVESVNYDPEYTGGNPSHEARYILMSWLMVSGSEEVTKKNFDKGIHLMKDALNYLNDPEARKRLSVVLHNRGVDLVNNERYDQGIKLLLEALSYNNNPDTRKVLGQAYMLRAAQKYQRGDRYGAIQDADEALRYDPYNREFRDLRNRMNY